jgi:hypothetical protein
MMEKCKIKNGKVQMCDSMQRCDDRIEFQRERPYFINYGLSLITVTKKTETDFVTEHKGIGTLWEDKKGMHAFLFNYCPFCGEDVRLTKGIGEHP